MVFTYLLFWEISVWFQEISEKPVLDQGGLSELDIFSCLLIQKYT